MKSLKFIIPSAAVILAGIAFIHISNPFKSIQMEYCANWYKGKVLEKSISIPLTVYNSDEPNLTNIPVIVDLKKGYFLENDRVVDTLTLDLGEAKEITVRHKDKSKVYKIGVKVTHELPVYTDFPLQNGYNLGFWFGQGQGWLDNGEPFFGGPTEERIQELVGYGFDHFRIPIDEEVMWREDGTFREEGIQTLHNLLGWIQKTDAKVIVDLHWLRVSNDLPNEAAERDFRRCWKMLNDELCGYDKSFLAYELLNEANGRDGYWNEFLANSIAMIRAWGQRDRVIVCGATNYQEWYSLDDMILPKDDPNLIAAFHYYAPMLLTHYGTGWTTYRGPVHYPGYIITDDEWFNELTEEQRTNPQAKWFKAEWFDKNNILESLTKAKENAERLGVRIHCGEFACSVCVPMEDNIRWYKDMTDALREVGIPAAQWPFGLGENYTEDGRPLPAIIKSLTGKVIE